MRRAAGVNGDQRAERGAHGAGGHGARTRTGPVSAAHRGESREHHGQWRAGHAGKQAPGHGGRPQEPDPAGNVDHTSAPARQPARQRLTRGENFRCAELAMTPVECHSQHTPCVHKGALARGRCASPSNPHRRAPESGSRESGRRCPRSFLAARWRLIRRIAVASGRGGAVVPVAGATTVMPLLSLLRAKLSLAGDARAWCFRR